jgi:hypothetical protein
MVTAAIFFGANGTASAATVSPTNFDFGSQSVGTTSAPHFSCSLSTALPL